MQLELSDEVQCETAGEANRSDCCPTAGDVSRSGGDGDGVGEGDGDPFCAALQQRPGIRERNRTCAATLRTEERSTEEKNRGEGE
jgi:hypothetical protein